MGMKPIFPAIQSSLFSTGKIKLFGFEPGAIFLLVDCDGSVVLLIIVLLKSIAFRRNTSCLLKRVG